MKPLAGKIKQLEIEYETEKNKNEITVLNQKNQFVKSNAIRLHQAGEKLYSRRNC